MANPEIPSKFLRLEKKRLLQSKAVFVVAG